MGTKKAHAHIWSKVSQFDRQAVLYAFRFDNGKTKFGKSMNIMSRTGDHLAHGITGCVGVTVVRVEAHAIDALEQLMLEHVATKHKRLANEVFVSSQSEAEDERMIRHATGGGLPRPAPSQEATWREQHDAEIDRLRAEGKLQVRPKRSREHRLSEATSGTLTDEQKRAYLGSIGFTPSSVPAGKVAADEQRLRAGWVAEWRERNPVVSKSERPVDARTPRERYLASLQPFRSNRLPAQGVNAETEEGADRNEQSASRGA
jgi:hypothetical protein